MTRDDHNEQQNLKINVNVILNGFFCLFYKMRTNSVQWINESAGFSITVHE